MTQIIIAGDSTAAIKEPNKRPEMGWGEMFHNYVPKDYTIINKAMNGRSTKSFIQEGRLKEIEELLQPDDYLLIQFGHNDQKEDERGTDPDSDYQSYLLEYINVANKKKATPILLTSITRRDYLSDSKKLNPNTLGNYPQAMKDLATEQGLYVVDIFEKSQKLLSTYSAEETKTFFLHLPENSSENYPEGITDNTHLNPNGAELIAQLIATELKKLPLPLAKDIRIKGD
ncbi:rhamnogalacturonan acetylesterase [Enterococcus sp. JM4C]|uniref:rhamnogalacturonan acetylesterase n=1 Tax=Candidatus Enterococcus huntleyi TaxID=1857217 RepID=UPI001379960A|nr:rhamnogalacturonan acetylesterase [Enterococcus sp. JM4C]KAF1299153.1 rhamnogalacturonan acetylesterase [Enterococcus sp. JM4C]